ncbi:MAG: helix-turn-helix domain-containing protein [Ekhidna sp.]|uniref:helix-turn-helix domain-containing protein n=1 Tax=Ekhidna sp. TaxID=2608089 RepID=UPI0032EE4361
MTKDIPHINFNPATTDNFGFEIVPIEKIAQNRNQNKHNSELPHQLKFYNLIFFTEGHGRHFIDFNWHKVQENTLVYITKEQINAFDFSRNLKGFCLVFTEEFFVKCFSNLSKGFVFRLFNPQLFSPILEIPTDSDFNTYFNLLQKEYNNPRVLIQKNIIESLFTILITKAEDIKQTQTAKYKDSTKIKVFQNFTSLIEQNLSTSRSADFYAKELAITYKHLNIICKNLVNKTAKNVINDLVILKAKRSLINSHIRSNELAFKLGFEDPTNFTKYFKKNTGLTPKEFIMSASKL